MSYKSILAVAGIAAHRGGGKMKKAFLVFALVVMTMVSSVFAQELWGGTQYGMSLNEVKGVVADGIAPKDPGTLKGGAVELLRKNNINIVNNLFMASFFFKDEKLVQVTLKLNSGYAESQGRTVFRSLREALTVKYGQELSSEASSLSSSVTWMAANTNIILFYMPMGDASVLNVNYQVRLSKEAGKL